MVRRVQRQRPAHPLTFADDLVQSPTSLNFEQPSILQQMSVQAGLQAGPGNRRGLLASVMIYVSSPWSLMSVQIGVRYWGTDNVLDGAYADVDDMKRLLIGKFGAHSLRPLTHAVLQRNSAGRKTTSLYSRTTRPIQARNPRETSSCVPLPQLATLSRALTCSFPATRDGQSCARRSAWGPAILPL